ncbi:hypothetical protein SAY86_020972 [Trapa natans]|uniref:Uncharacterized protein n=1 Tax=Trapa natans TaxID=22666 RepID=A0AAN7MRM0_TRANT|nr:hypothetical protein SAY86_020972 [Trapa natans]
MYGYSGRSNLLVMTIPTTGPVNLGYSFGWGQCLALRSSVCLVFRVRSAAVGVRDKTLAAIPTRDGLPFLDMSIWAYEGNYLLTSSQRYTAKLESG